ncbi:MAG: DUF4314 domain-containing protein [Ruminococcus sp.]|nr:DUF4314 domain-containing protein [Ruminococcus sp.]
MYDREKINTLKNQYPKGTRICLDSMDNDPHPIPSGTKGTVELVDDIGTIHCKFDDGRYLGIIPDEDSFHIIHDEVQTEELSEEPEMNMSM